MPKPATQLQMLCQHLATYDKRDTDNVDNFEIAKCEECGRPFPKTTNNRKYCWLHSNSKSGNADERALSDIDILAQMLLYWYTSDQSSTIYGFSKTITVNDRKS